MEDLFKNIAGYIALTIESIGVIVIVAGTIQTTAMLAVDLFHNSTFGWRRRIWLNFGVWIMLGLQFLLAADIVRTAFAPTWTNIGQLAAVAAIRTFLSIFLERDVDKADAGERNENAADSRPTPIR